MKIGGWEPFSLTDFAGHCAAVVFTQGCNFRCPFCHNGELIPFTGNRRPIEPSEVFMFLKTRIGKLDGIVLGGGEPTLQPNLSGFLEELQAMGFRTKLDTNGSRPDVIGRLVADNRVDYIAMDVKAPFSIYPRLTGVPVDNDAIRDSMAVIADSGLPHEFRTTVVPHLLSARDLSETKKQVPTGSPYRQQAYRPVVIPS
ncbi:MAG: anaerobic ribonucleoside-triphosphate reductase activating protein [Proteobacteria bacterium]|nr:anaerobic ribonucleoside-triphosphate reductase activating protein [Pseudomonadota bacterium]